MTKQLFLIAVFTSLFGSVAGGIVLRPSHRTSTLETAKVQTESLPQLFTVTRQRPWQIAGQDQCSTTVKTTAEQVDGVEVQAKTFRCLGELPLAEVEFYYSRGDGQLFVRTDLLALRNLWSYSIDGRVFAYRAAYVKVDIRSDGSRQYGGAIFVLDYYDEDGDGKFETRYGKLTNIKIPEWYKSK